MQSQLLGRLRQENPLNPVGGGCSESRLYHHTPAWATEQNSILKKRKERKEGKGRNKEREGAGCSDSHLYYQNFGRWRWVDHEVRSLRPA